MACLLVGRVYKSATLTDALAGAATIRQFTNITADSYTVMVRPDPQTTLDDIYATYDSVCSAIALTIEGIQFACADQGYIPTIDSLRVNVGTEATFTIERTNALPLVVFSDRVGPKCKDQLPGGKPTEIETTLALHANYCGGLGKSTMYTSTRLNGYEVLRLGYMLYGKNNILSFDNYLVAIACYPSYAVNETFNQRILTLVVEPSPVSITQTMYRWNHPRFASISWFQVSSIDME
ncbi:hypothetical protein AC1031_018500 [Aphanomyces cochlioides]|nr:hypothetical protein AC1031_018500 [Aphanomyces cochlioides]